MIKHINKEIKIKLYCCDLCDEESRDIMRSCSKCKRHMCNKCCDRYNNVLSINQDTWYDLCKDCVKLISDLKTEQENLADRLWDIENEVIKLIGGIAS